MLYLVNRSSFELVQNAAGFTHGEARGAFCLGAFCWERNGSQSSCTRSCLEKKRRVASEPLKAGRSMNTLPAMM